MKQYTSKNLDRAKQLIADIRSGAVVLTPDEQADIIEDMLNKAVEFASWLQTQKELEDALYETK